MREEELIAVSDDRLDRAAPPVRFGPERAYFDFSVAVPQFHMVLVSLLQGITFGVLVLSNPPRLPDAWSSALGFMLSHYLYAPYILSSLLILEIWTNYIYASSLIVWPASVSQAFLIYAVSVAEIFTVSNVQSLPQWLFGAGIVVLLSAVVRINNWRVMRKEDFEDQALGAVVRRNELLFAAEYVIIGCCGLAGGVLIDAFRQLTHGALPQVNADGLVHWSWYSATAVFIAINLVVEGKYREWFLKRVFQGVPAVIVKGGTVHDRLPLPEAAVPATASEKK